MKLYEFSYVCDYCDVNTAIQCLKPTLEEESSAQGWEDGYEIKESAPSIQLEDNRIEYFFVIYGNYIE